MNQPSIQLAAVGDLALGDHPARVGNGVGAVVKQKGYDYPFSKISYLFSKYDCVFGNLEYAFKKEPKQLDFYNSQCFANPMMSEVLANSGFSVLNMASNHIAQFGKDNYKKTAALLKKNNIIPIGIAGNTCKNTIPAVFESNGIKTGWLGYSLRPRQHFTDDPPYAEGVTEIILADIKALKLSVNHVIVSVHWGDEFIEKPSPDEISMAHEMIDSGASVILGHHPHVLRGLENYKGGLIAYSLGNFVCDMVWENRLIESMVLEVELYPDQIGGYDFVPVVINETFQPAVVTDEKEKEHFFERQKIRDNYVREVIDFYIDEKYKDEALKELQLNRKASHRYFFRNIRQYHLKIILQQILQSIKSRL